MTQHNAMPAAQIVALKLTADTPLATVIERQNLLADSMLRLQRNHLALLHNWTITASTLTQILIQDDESLLSDESAAAVLAEQTVRTKELEELRRLIAEHDAYLNNTPAAQDAAYIEAVLAESQNPQSVLQAIAKLFDADGNLAMQGEGELTIHFDTGLTDEEEYQQGLEQGGVY